MIFEKAKQEDVARIWEIIGQAKAQMRRLGSHQWNENYPAYESIRQDIEQGEGYVFRAEGRVVAYGVVSFGGEPAYDQIREQWANNLPYMVVHRLAVADEMKRQGLARRFMAEAEGVAKARGVYSFRVDTNYDNTYMLRLIEAMGFEYRGEVVYRGDCRRKAFDKTLRPEASVFGSPGYTIREAMLDDAEAIYSAIDSHRDDLRTWLPFVDALRSADDERAFLAPILSTPYEERDPVYVLEKGKRICGLVGFHLSQRENKRTEIGYWLLPEHRGKGIATNAVRYLCQWAMTERGFNRIQIRCATGNAASNAIPQRLGFTLEGTERDGELLASGRFTDVNVYSILRKDIIKPE